MSCGTGECGCGCGDLVQLETPKQKAEKTESQKTADKDDQGERQDD